MPSFTRWMPLVLALSVLTGCGTNVVNPVTGQVERSAMDERAELAEGKKAHEQVKEQYGVYDHPRLQAYVNEIGQKLAAQSHRTNIPWTFTVLDSSEINAFALPFAAEETAPLYSIILVDPGTKAGALDAATLKTIGFPITIAIDPTRADATADADAYRAAGFEVAILASALPQGATAQDLEVAVEAWRQAIPEAVAVVEPTKPVLQTNRLLSQTLVKILAREGLGLVTQSGGLNAADQLAAKDGVPHTTVWRVIDEGREKAPVIERMLGRASFEAAKGDGITVMLSAWPESISGLLTWEPGREKNVMLAPISAMALRAE